MDERKWRIEFFNGSILRDVDFRYFTETNGYELKHRVIIGNMEIGQMIRMNNNSIFKTK